MDFQVKTRLFCIVLILCSLSLRFGHISETLKIYRIMIVCLGNLGTPRTLFKTSLGWYCFRAILLFWETKTVQSLNILTMKTCVLGENSITSQNSFWKVEKKNLSTVFYLHKKNS